MSDVFLSYSRVDKGFVRRLHDALAAQQRDSWVDWDDIVPSTEWLKEIYAGIEASDAFIFVVSPQSADSEMCRRELAHASTNHKRIIPLLFRAVDPQHLPEPISEIQWIAFDEATNFDKSFQVLLRTIETDLEWWKAHTRLLTRANDWERWGRDDSYLLRGKDLEEVERWLARVGQEKEPRPTTLQSQFILASQARQREEQQRWKDLYEESERQRRVAVSRQAAAQAVSVLSSALDLALILAVEANLAWDTLEARSALLNALMRCRSLRVFLRGLTERVFPSIMPLRYPALAFSPDGGLLAAASGVWTNDIVLWDVGTAQPLGPPMEGHTKPVSGIVFSPHGQTLASGSEDGTILRWDVGKRRPLGSALSGHDQEITCLAMSANGILASGSLDNSTRLWDVNSGQALGLFQSKETRNITHLAFDPESKLLACVGHSSEPGKDEITILWDIPSQRMVGAPLEGLALAFAPDGRYLLAIDASRSHVCRIDLRTRERSILDVSDADTPLTCLSVSPDSRLLAAGGWRRINFFDLARHEVVGVPLDAHSGLLNTVSFNPSGDMLASTAFDDAVILWDVGEPRFPSRTIAAHKGARGVVFAADGAVLGVPCGSEGFILRDPRSGEVLLSSDTPAESMRLSKDGQRAALATPEKQLFLVDLDRSESPRITAMEGVAVALSPHANGMALGRSDGSIDWRETGAGMPVGRASGEDAHRGPVVALDFSPDGTMLASVDAEGCVLLWDTPSGRLVVRIPDAVAGSDVALAFSPGGEILLITGNESMCLWDVARGRVLRRFTRAHGIGAPLIAAFSSDGRILAWSTLASREINLQEMRSGWEFGRPFQYGKPDTYVTGIGFSPQAAVLASAHSDGTITFWDFDVKSWKRRAGAIANRNLTDEEWEQYLGGAHHRKTFQNLA